MGKLQKEPKSQRFWAAVEGAELKLSKNREGKGLGAFLLALITIASLSLIAFLVWLGTPAEILKSLLGWL